MITNYNPMFGSKEQCEDLVRQIKANNKTQEENKNMKNKILFYVDTIWLGEGNTEYTIVKLCLESGDARLLTTVKGKSRMECSESLHQLILKEKPSQVIFENTGIAAASKDSYVEYLSQYSGDVLMDKSGKLFYNLASS
ncbi:hypothetical protein [Paenibacillus taichungensis]